MKKIIIATVVILVVIGIITAVAVITKNSMKKHILDGPGMERQPHDYINSCSYNYGGGMEGESEHIELTMLSDGSFSYSYYYCPTNGGEETKVEKTFADSQPVMDAIREICKRTGVLTWGELPDSELMLLDAPTTAISFRFFDDCFYSVNSNRIIEFILYGFSSNFIHFFASLKIISP